MIDSAVIVILGMTATGKSTIAARLIDMTKFENAVLYSTRPMRPGDVNGKDYFFTDDAGIKRLKENGELLSIQSYETINGVWHYALAEKSLTCSQNNKILVSNADMFQDLIKIKRQINMISFYLDLDEPVLVRRILDDSRGISGGVYENLRRYRVDYDAYIKARDVADYVVNCTDRTPNDISNEILSVFNSLTREAIR